MQFPLVCPSVCHTLCLAITPEIDNSRLTTIKCCLRLVFGSIHTYLLRHLPPDWPMVYFETILMALSGPCRLATQLFFESVHLIFLGSCQLICSWFSGCNFNRSLDLHEIKYHLELFFRSIHSYFRMMPSKLFLG